MNISFHKQVESRLKSIIAEVTGYEESLLDSDMPFTSKEQSDKMLTISSLEFAELLITIDEEFHVNIPDETALTLNTINSLADYISQHL